MASSRFISKDVYSISKNFRNVYACPKAAISTSSVRNTLPPAVTAISQCSQRNNVSSSTSTNKVDDPAFTAIDLSFENYEEAYKSKSNLDLFRALMVFNVCTINPIVDNNKVVSTL